MGEHAVEPVRPHRAVWAGPAHVVDHEQRILVAKELRQANRALSADKTIVSDLLRLDFGLQDAHPLAQRADFAAVLGQFHRRLAVGHAVSPFAGGRGNRATWRACRIAPASSGYSG